MSDKKGFSARVESFIGGRGFYIVLFACIAVIGVSAWVLLFSGLRPGGDEAEDYAPVMAGAPELPTDGLDSDVLAPDGDDAVQTVNPIDIPEEPEPQPEPDEPSEPVKPDPAPAPEPEPEDGGEGQSAESLTFIWPLSGAVAVEYSPDSLIYDRTMEDWRTHSGVDISAQIGTKVMAAAMGTVESVFKDDLYGTTVRIDHGDGLVSVYSNLAEVPTVKPGDAVTMGSVIGSVGDTALAETGEVSHLHFAMEQDGSPADPASYLPRK